MIELSDSQERRAKRLHEQAIIVDTHCDTLMQLLPQPWGMPEARILGNRSDRGHIDLPRMIEGGVTCQTFAIYTGRRAFVPEAPLVAMQMVDKFYSMIEENPEIVPVINQSEIIEAKNSGKVCGLLSMEGAEPLMGDLAALRVFYRLGMRMLSFAWNYRTPFADGLGAKRAESKLPELGVQALEEMEKLGIIFDVSHLADSVFWDVNDVMNGPFIASHSNSRNICDHPRNLTDDMIKAVADHGGVLGMNFATGFVKKDTDTVTVDDLVDHIDHIVELVGPDYVGLGSDYDGIREAPKGIEEVSKLPNLTRVLVKRDYSDEDIFKILGGNHLRVFKEVLG
ncbi:membrane dipeptidase [Candidatus Bathyarchaeota archaeon]|nr:membrane dipeptidase [Candidatus Bathyarchaeota archaeon]